MEQRKKTAVVLLRKPGTRATKVELFPAAAFGGPAGAWRLRVNGRWHCPESKYDYLHGEALGTFLARLAVEVDASPIPPRPDLPKGTPVRVPNGKVVEGMAMMDVTITTSWPILTLDGRWHVQVALYGQGSLFVPCDDVKPRRKQ